MTPVVIVSDIRLYREGLADALARDGRLTVQHKATSTDDAMAMLSPSRPVVILLDMSVPNANSFARAVARSYEKKTVVAMGIAQDRDEIIACAEAGIAGFVPREASIEDLVLAVESAAAGKLQCSEDLAGALLRRVAQLAAHEPHAAPESSLTARELQVVDLIDEGMTNKEIASTLCISEATVKNHVHNVLDKLQASTRGEAAARLRSMRVLGNRRHRSRRSRPSLVLSDHSTSQKI